MRTKNGINVHPGGYVTPMQYEALRPGRCQACGKRAERLWSRETAYRDPETKSVAGFLCLACTINQAADAITATANQFPAILKQRILAAVLADSIRGIPPRSGISALDRVVN